MPNGRLGGERTADRAVALDALQMALTDRQPPQGLLHHSDRGSQYASHQYQQLLAAHGALSSMSRKGNCCGATSPSKVALVACIRT